MKKTTCALAALAFAGCGAETGSYDATCKAIQPLTAVDNPDWPGTIFTIMLENKNASDIFGTASAPYINQLAKQGAIAGGYHDPYVHPSEPNYLWAVSGENFDITDDNDPSSHSIASTSHIADQLEAAGLTWRAYEEGMGSACGLVSHGRYAAKHDPFVFFDDINGWDGSTFQPSQRCTQHVVDYSQLATDLGSGALPRYVFITPNLDDDMHDGSIAQGDQWLANEVPKILASDAYQNGGALFIFWDEGAGSLEPGDDPPFFVVSPNAKVGYTSAVDYDSGSYLATIETIFGLQVLPCASPTDTDDHKPMADLFEVPLSPSAGSASSSSSAGSD